MNKQELIEKWERTRENVALLDGDTRLHVLQYIDIFLKDLRKMDEPNGIKDEVEEFGFSKKFMDMMTDKLLKLHYKQLEELEVGVSHKKDNAPAKEESGNGVPFAMGDSAVFIQDIVKEAKEAGLPEW